MYRIGIISKPNRDLFQVRAELGKYTSFKIEGYTDAPNAVSVLREKSLNGLVVIVEEFTEKSLGLVTKIRQLHANLPIVFVANKLSEDNQKKARKLSAVIAIRSESELTDIIGIMNRMIRGQKVFNRVDKRQKTMQIATVEFNGREHDRGCILDLASHGARLRSFKLGYKRGDKLRITIPLSFLRKSYRVEAEIVWAYTEPVTNSHPTESSLLGLKFISVLG